MIVELSKMHCSLQDILTKDLPAPPPTACSLRHFKTLHRNVYSMIEIGVAVEYETGYFEVRMTSYSL